MMSNKNRLSWIDSLKGVGIFFVMLGHMPVSVSLHYYIYAFHMPLFFFASGYLFNSAKYAKFKDFFLKKVKTLLLPYVYFSIFSIFLYCVYANFGETKKALSFKEIFWQFIIGKRNNIPYNKALWFFPALFAVSLIYYFADRYIKNNLAIISFSLVLSSAGYIYFKTLIAPKLFWSFDSSFYYLIFYAAGNLISECRQNKEGAANILRKNLAMILFFILALIVNTSLLWNAELFEQIKFYFNTLLFGFAGIAVFALFSKIILEKIGKTDIFKYLGKNSLVIFSLHLALCYPVLGKLFSLLNIKIKNADLLGLSYVLLSIIMLSPIIYAINNFLPFLIGQKRPIAKNSVK